MSNPPKQTLQDTCYGEWFDQVERDLTRIWRSLRAELETVYDEDGEDMTANVEEIIEEAIDKAADAAFEHAFDVIHGVLEQLNTLSEQEQMEAVYENKEIIEGIFNPSEKVEAAKTLGELHSSE